MSDTLKQSTGGELIAAARVEGVSVFGPRGEKLGAIKDIYIDKRTGQAEFVSLAFGGVLGLGERHHPVPWSALEYDKALDGFRIGLTQAELTGGPGYAADQLTGEDGWAREVRAYYSELPAMMPTGEARPGRRGGRHFTHGTAAATADMAVGAVRHGDKAPQAPHARPIKPADPATKIDHLAEKVDHAENRQEALLDEGVEESFPASDPVSVKHIT